MRRRSIAGVRRIARAAAGHYRRARDDHPSSEDSHRRPGLPHLSIGPFLALPSSFWYPDFRSIRNIATVLAYDFIPAFISGMSIAFNSEAI